MNLLQSELFSKHPTLLISVGHVKIASISDHREPRVHVQGQVCVCVCCNTCCGPARHVDIFLVFALVFISAKAHIYLN